MMLIHRTIERVLVYGPTVEAVLMERKARMTNSSSCLILSHRNTSTIDGNYSMLNGDEKNKWRTDPFPMYDEDRLDTSRNPIRR
ncbi:hypothetical protein BC829DRAFT_212602 [Chytridium lagenaria]|nr:hypothetical protein BC829DRAFT_212602 [Chytridium lagenaria]